MPSPNDLGEIFKQIFGGNDAQKLPEVVKQFEEKGMREQVDSWVRPGPNKPVDRRQIEDVFGDRELETIARSACYLFPPSFILPELETALTRAHAEAEPFRP